MTVESGDNVPAEPDHLPTRSACGEDVATSESYRRLRGFVIAASIGFLLLLGGLLGSFLWIGREELAARTAQHAEALARAMEEHTARTIESADSIIAVTALELVRDWGSIPPSWPPGVTRRTEELPQLRAVIVLDPNGILVLDTENANPGKLDLSDREYFKVLKADPTRGLFLADPIYGRDTGRWFLPLARAIIRPDGSFAGVVTGIVEPTYFDAFYNSLGLGEDNSIAVFSDTGIVVTRYPFPERYVGTSYAERPLFAALSASPSGVGPTPTTDGVPRMVAHRRVAGFPLIVTVGLTEDFTFSGWRKQAMMVSAGFAVAATAVALLTLLILRQISRLLRSEADLRQRGRELERSNLELEQFAYIASHDLQEPLRMVTSYLQLIERRCADKLEVEVQQFIGYAVDGARRMQGLVRDLLQLSRVGRQQPMRDRIDLRECVDRAMRSLGPAIDEAKAEIVVGPGLPSIVGTEAELLSLFQNLIGNALKYRHLPRQCRIEVSAQKRGAEWLIVIEDNGIGIDPDFHERIFLPFQRLHPVGQFEGSGIGLAIARKVVERHGGRIWVEARRDQTGALEGSRFCFTLPEASEGSHDGRPKSPSGAAT